MNLNEPVDQPGVVAVPPTSGLELAVTSVLVARSGSDAARMVAEVAELLRQTWPAAVSVKRRGMFNRGTPVAMVLRMPNRQYGLEIVDGRARSWVAEARGGVALSHTQVSVEQWASALARDMVEVSAQDELASRALRALAGS
jgi:hypothetical protein